LYRQEGTYSPGVFERHFGPWSAIPERFRDLFQGRPNKWQRVRIEFEYESREYRDHGHPLDGCEVIVCWRHNWADCPENLEVVELASVIRALAKSDD
jgi:hypothetical protein